MPYISNEQKKRDASGKKNFCAACGFKPTVFNKLILSTEGSRIHRSHTEDPNSGFFGKAQ